MVDCDYFKNSDRTLVIERSRVVLESSSLDYSLEIPFHSKLLAKTKKSDASNALRKLPIQAVYGIMDLEVDKYLIVVTKASVIGQIYERKIYQLDRAEFIPLNSSSTFAPQDKPYLDGLANLFKLKHFYYSDDYDLTKSLEKFIESGCSMNRKNDQYFFNSVWVQDFVRVDALEWITGFISGLIIINFVTFSPCYICEMVIVSRRDKRRQGTRWVCRGSNLDGHTANTAETEQIFSVKKNDVETFFSFVQTRGSMPFKWQQKPDLKWEPKCEIIGNERVNIDLCKKHFEDQKQSFPNICILNLVDKKGKQKMLGEYFQKMISSLNDESIRYVWFDFHAECKKMKYENLIKLIHMVETEISNYGYYHIEKKNKIISRKNSQKGVFRTNCMDCLDRTNVVQSVLARYVLHDMLTKAGITPQKKSITAFEHLPDPLEKQFRESWTKNADAISTLYSGTPAMKTDFTLTGKRTVGGAFNDLMYGTKRYFLGNFYDSTHQDYIDVSLGKLKPKKQKVKFSKINVLFIIALLMLILPFTVHYAVDNHLFPVTKTPLLQSAGQHTHLQTEQPANNNLIYKVLGSIGALVVLFKLIQTMHKSIVRRPTIDD